MALGGRLEIEVVPELSKFPGQLQSGLRSSSGIAAAAGRGIGLAFTAGIVGAGAGLAAVISIGREYEASLNTLQAVTQATGAEMEAVGARAKELGSDLTLPGTSAATAAAAMTELAKGGLSVQQAMDAAKGTLTLAAAAQIDGAQAAQIQSDSLNIFGLAASEAGRVADVLANAANSSAVEITDVAEAMKYIGPVARSMGVSMEDTATAVGLLGNAGIRGSDAGTSLRGMLASLVAPSGAAGKAIGILGLETRNAAGEFVGFPSIIDQLRAAQGRLDKSTFDSAVVTAFGRETMSGVLALVNSAPDSWDKMSTAVTRAGGAEEVAAARTQGLGGAMEGFRSTLETVAINLYGILDGPLEQLVDAATSGVDGINTALEGVGEGDIGAGLSGSLSGVREVLDNVRDAAEPVAAGIVRVVASMDDGQGPVSTFGAALGIVGTTASGLSSVLVPVGSVVGGLLGVFAALPGPVQTAALALLAFRVLPGIFSNLASSTGAVGTGLTGMGNAARTVASPVTGLVGAVRQFNDEARVQRSLADASGQSIGRLGGYVAAFETSTQGGVAAVRTWRDSVREMSAAATGAGAPIGTMQAGVRALAEQSPAVGRMRDAFVSASEGAGRLGPALGTVAAAGSGMRTALGGITSALGGPWGLAIGAAITGLSLWAGANADAEAKTAAHRSRVDELAASFDKVTGAATEASREMAAQELTSVKLSDGTTTLNGALTKLGIDTRTYVDATLGNVAAQREIAAELNNVTRAAIENSGVYQNNRADLDRWGISLDLITAAANGNVQAQQQMDDALRRGAGGVLENEAANRMLGTSLRDLGGVSGEVASQFGAAIGTYNEAKTAADATREATLAFSDALRGLGDLRVFDAIAAGNPVTREMAAGLSAAGAAAEELALGAGRTVSATSGLEQGAAAAGGKMAELRGQFVQAATAAGLGEQAANDLANSYGLIPSAVETIIRTNATGVAAEMVTLNAQIQSVPAGKDVTVRALTDEARNRLQDLGFQVENLEDGTFRIIGNDEDARAKLAAMVADGNAAVATMRLDANVDPATGKVNGTLQFANGSTGTVTIDANGNPADIKIGNTKYKIDTTTGIMTIDGNPAPGEADRSGLKVSIDRTTGTVTILGNDADARRKVQDLQKPTSSTHTINVRYFATNRLPATGGGSRPIQEQAQGGVLHAMARGGHLSPMRGGVAQVVPPNTWRVIGDRLKDDEAYIPINRSRRSAAIFEETARRLGYTVARMYAGGGVAERMSAQLAAQRSTSSNSDVVAAIGGLSGRLGAVERSISIVNQFYTESSAKESDMVARVQRRQAALGLLGG